ncbi:hypothetical protein KAR91_80010 [Candidatus Pacearchaeota archaeon]|nr:hypothetical protein [Candidatus Pacearchaeota archaeon]
MKCFYNRKAAALLLLQWFLVVAAPGKVFAEQKTVSEALKTAREAKVSEAEISRVLAYGYDIRISASDVIDLLEILTDAHNQGFPLDNLLNKIDEGLVKQVRFEVLTGVLKKKVGDYHFVLSLFNKTRKGKAKKDVLPALPRVADSLDFGLTREDLQSLFRGVLDVPMEMFAVASLNMAFLKQLGFDSGLAFKIMRTGFKYKSLSPEWEKFCKVVAAGKRKGIADRELSDTAVRILADRKGLRELLKELGFTGRNLRHGPMKKPAF